MASSTSEQRQTLSHEQARPSAHRGDVPRLKTVRIHGGAPVFRSKMLANKKPTLNLANPPVKPIPPAQIPIIPRVVTDYLNALVSSYPGITAIWIFGSRANGTCRDDSDWDFLVFGDRSILDALRADETFRRPDIDLFVVYDGNRFESPWHEGDSSKRGRLNNSFELEKGVYVYGYRWRELSETEAVYISTRDPSCTDRLRAYRIYAKDPASA